MNTNLQNTILNVDSLITNHVSAVGLFQIIIATLSGLSDIPSPLVSVFVFGPPDYRCKLDDEYEKNLGNLSFNDAAAIVGPSKYDGITSKLLDKSQIGCYRYSMFNNSTSSLTKCSNGYIYQIDKMYYPDSLIEKWNLVCDDSWKVPFTTTAFMLGMMFGYLTGGQLGGILGRRRAILLMAYTQFFSVMGLSLSPNYVIFIILRFLSALAFSGVMNCFFVLMNELTLSKSRSIYVGMSFLISGFINRSLMVLVALNIKTWRLFNAVALLPSAVCLLCPFIIPESPRWLISQQRPKEALLVLYKAFKINHMIPFLNKKPAKLISISDKYFLDALGDDIDPKKYIGLFRQPSLDAKSHSEVVNYKKSSNYVATLKTMCHNGLPILTIKCIFIYTFQIMICYGLMYYVRIMKVSVYFSITIYSFIAIGSTVLSCLFYRICSSRKKPIIFTYSFIACLFIATGLYTVFAKPENELFLIIGAFIGYLFVMVVHIMLFIYVPELFPLEFRTQGLGIASGLGRIGSTSCDFINQLDLDYMHGLPLLVYGGIIVLQIMILCTLRDVPIVSEYAAKDDIKDEEEFYMSANELNTR